MADMNFPLPFEANDVRGNRLVDAAARNFTLFLTKKISDSLRIISKYFLDENHKNDGQAGLSRLTICVCTDAKKEGDKLEGRGLHPSAMPARCSGYFRW